MDNPGQFRHFPDMPRPPEPVPAAPAWNLYGEDRLFPDVLHVERVRDRAAGLGWVIGEHRHPHLHQFFLIRSGRAEVRADGRAFSPDAPFVLSIPKGVVHGFTFSARTDGYVLTIPLATLPSVFDPATAAARSLGRVEVVAADAALAAAFDRIHAEHRGRAAARPLMLAALATEIACLLLRRLPPRPGASTQPADPRAQRFFALVEAHLRERWTVEDYARAVGVSGRHLARLCVAATGAAPGAFVEAALMREACRLLAYTRAPVAAVGFDLGFDDPSYFSRAFRQHMGLSPRAYRRRLDAEPQPGRSLQPSATV